MTSVLEVIPVQKSPRGNLPYLLAITWLCRHTAFVVGHYYLCGYSRWEGSARNIETPGEGCAFPLPTFQLNLICAARQAEPAGPRTQRD